MDTCTVETGLLKKKPCGETSVTHCLNCEQPLCAKHAVPELSGTGKKTGKFLCKECSIAYREHDKAVGAAPVPKPAPAPAPKPAAAPQKPEAAAAPKPAPAAVPKPAPAAAKPIENTDGSIEFTPSKPDDQK